jgi:membrane-associated phospholipid phosphatase
VTQRQVASHELGEYVRGLVPQELVPVFVAVTYLGNAGLFLTVFALDYWFGDRSRGAHALGVAVGGLGLVVALKSFFAQPRPPDSVAAIAISGYAFPSGHAMQSTIGYGILAHDLDVGTERQRYAVAGVLVSLVALSRVVIGVHYVRDVVAGVVIASLFLAGTLRLTNRAPGPAFLLAAALGTAAVGISGASHHGLAVFGASLGTVVAWRYLVGDETLESRVDRVVLVFGVLPILSGLGYAAVELRPPPVVVVSLTAALTAGTLLAPRVVDRVTHAAGLDG